MKGIGDDISRDLGLRRLLRACLTYLKRFAGRVAKILLLLLLLLPAASSTTTSSAGATNSSSRHSDAWRWRLRGSAGGTAATSRPSNTIQHRGAIYLISSGAILLPHGSNPEEIRSGARRYLRESSGKIQAKKPQRFLVYFRLESIIPPTQCVGSS